MDILSQTFTSWSEGVAAYLKATGKHPDISQQALIAFRSVEPVAPAISEDNGVMVLLGKPYTYFEDGKCVVDTYSMVRTLVELEEVLDAHLDHCTDIRISEVHDAKGQLYAFVWTSNPDTRKALLAVGQTTPAAEPAAKRKPRAKK